MEAQRAICDLRLREEKQITKLYIVIVMRI